MAPKILIFGAGSVGGVYAVILSRAVPAADITVICRSNFDAVSKNGITLHSTLPRWGRDLHVKPCVARTVPDAVQASQGANFDYIVVTSKALETTSSTAELIRPAVTPGTTIVLIQNGIRIEAPFAALFPENPILSTVVYLPATQLQPGVIEHKEVELLHIGTYPATAPATPQKAAASAFADLLTRAGASSQLHDDVQAERWSKLLVNASWNSLCALTRCRDRQLLDVSTQLGDYAGFVRDVMLEIAATAQACGYEGINEALVDLQLQRATSRELPGIQPSMMADALAGRNMEVEAIIGNTVRLAREKGVSTPMLQTIYFLAAGLDKSFSLARS